MCVAMRQQTAYSIHSLSTYRKLAIIIGHSNAERKRRQHSAILQDCSGAPQLKDARTLFPIDATARKTG